MTEILSGGIGDFFYDHPYMVAFRIDTVSTSDADYDKRLTGLECVISQIAITRPWKDPTSCFIFRSNRGIESVSAAIARVLHHDLDIALIAQLDSAEARHIGKLVDAAALAAALPHAKKLG